jgi:hypothetical protein
MSLSNRYTIIAVLRTLLVAAFFTFSGSAVVADEPATAKPIDPATSDASQEGQLKNSPMGSLPVLSPGQNQPVYNATSPNLPGDPGVLNH